MGAQIQAGLIRVGSGRQAAHTGNKAANLGLLMRQGMRVPVTYVIPWEAHQRYQQNDVTVIEQIGSELEKKLDPTKQYAVRSSANIEDSFEHSFAGQFKTVLNVQGANALMRAIWAIWATARSKEVQEYLQKRNTADAALPSADAALPLADTALPSADHDLHMAVIVQEMVRPVFSGVAFSRNPMNGLRETVVEAVCGLGTALMQEGVTPYRWIYRNGRFSQRPAEDDIPLTLAEQVVKGTRRLASRLKRNVDLEWVFDGKELYWVQMREITSTHTVQVYSNRIAREMMAGMIKPLIFSINNPLVTSMWIRFISELAGETHLTPGRLVRPYYYRSYFNMGLLGEAFEGLGFPAETLEMMWGLAPADGQKFGFHPRLGMLRLLPRMLRFGLEKWTLPGRLERKLPELEAAVKAVDLEAVESLSPQEVLEGIERLYALNQDAAYFNIVVPLSMYAYHATLGSWLRRAGVDPTQVDMHRDSPEFQRYDPNMRLAELHQQFLAFPVEQQEYMRRCTYAELLASCGLDSFRTGVEQLLRDFGQLSDNGNDFSCVPWRENGDILLRLIVDYQPSQKEKPGSEGKIDFDALRLPWWQGWMFRRLYRRTRRFMLYREQISYIYTLGYSLFRVYFLALGRHFVQQGLLRESEDIFYLEFDEVRRMVGAGGDEREIQARVDWHRREMERVRSAALPEVIYGEQPPPLGRPDGHRLCGVPTSRGYCTAPVKVVGGLNDFSKVEKGDILVIPFSEVGWTPLFARAAGVIAESGGMLSHSSIVAREYGIPCIVSVLNATRLADGTLVSMDGYKGEIVVHQPCD